MTWRELRWAWEARTELAWDMLSLLRLDIQTLEWIEVKKGGGNMPRPDLRKINPLLAERRLE